MDRSEAVTTRYQSDFALEPPRTSTVVRPLIAAMDADGVSKNPKDRASWLATNVPAGGWSHRKVKLLEIWREAGLWLHSKGTLEDVLGGVPKDRDLIIKAASIPGDIDDVAQWCAYDVDPLGDVELLLSVYVERIAHDVMEAGRLNPTAQFDGPVGPSGTTDSRIVTLTPEGEGTYMLTVNKPSQFAGYWLRFSRHTPSSELNLQPPQNQSA